jgi:uncharacterized protein (TIGR03435 family)
MKELIQVLPERRLFLPTRQRILACAVVALGLLDLGQAHGQILIATAPRPTFEVATIRPSKADTVGMQTRMYRGNFTAEHASLNNLLKFAYRIKADDQIVGLPKWSETEVFDVNAKVDDDSTKAIEKLPLVEMMRQTRLKVQSLLADRFQLSVSVREESRKVYSLVVAKDGPKLKEVESSFTVAAKAPRNGEIAPPPPSSTPGTANPSKPPLDYSQSDRLTGRAASMDMLAQWLSTRQEVVVDHVTTLWPSTRP